MIAEKVKGIVLLFEEYTDVLQSHCEQMLHVRCGYEAVHHGQFNTKEIVVV